MPVKFALAALVASVAAQSEALVVWLSLPAPFFAALQLLLANGILTLSFFFQEFNCIAPASSNLFGAASSGFI